MNSSHRWGQATEDALAIWRAGVEAVRADRVIETQVEASRFRLTISDEEFELDPTGRLIVIGAGKAAAMMTKGFIHACRGLDNSIELMGWINIPEQTAVDVGDDRITVFEARPPGLNEPTRKVLEGTDRIVQLVQSASPRDTVVFLLTGGGSALLSAPIDGITLDEKLSVIRHLSSSGADIESLNTVRRALSSIKGGRLVRGCRAKQWLTLVISDVLGDSLEAIASGPSVLEASCSPEAALSVLHRFDPQRLAIPGHVYQMLEKGVRNLLQSKIPSPPAPLPEDGARGDARSGASKSPSLARLSQGQVIPCHFIMANNASAVDAAGIEAVRRGYAYWMQSSRTAEGSAESVGRNLARQLVDLQNQPEIHCLITGGEPTVFLAPPEIRGRGGRNQQLVLAALDELINRKIDPAIVNRLVLLSAGTDGEDGPTNAAGAWLNQAVISEVLLKNLSPSDFLRRCDAYSLFEQTRSLILSGPTHTNVCDLRVAILAKPK
jgi:glycerate-2-kinase